VATAAAVAVADRGGGGVVGVRDAARGAGRLLAPARVRKIRAADECWNAQRTTHNSLFVLVVLVDYSKFEEFE